MISREKQALRLQQLMQEEGLNAAELSRKTGIPKSSISNYLHCKSGMNLPRAKELGSFFGVDPEWLMGGDILRSPVFRERYEAPKQETLLPYRHELGKDSESEDQRLLHAWHCASKEVQQAVRALLSL